VQLTDDEKAMLDGAEGETRQRAIEILVKYGDALGAERLVDTNNVAGYMISDRELFGTYGNYDKVFSRTGLDSDKALTFPKVKAFSCQLETDMDPEWCEIEGKDDTDRDRYLGNLKWLSDIGVQLMCTCTPYQVGNVPVKGEHCAWMESSAVVYINSVLGARTNCEGNVSTTAAMLTGKIPYWGFHTDEHRYATDLVHVDVPIDNYMDWGLLGYYIGKMVEDGVPVLDGVKVLPSRDELKQFGAATASSGGVEMYHIPGITAEANTVDEALHGRKPKSVFHFGQAERAEIYEEINNLGSDTDVNFVLFGCPHNSIQQVHEICDLIEGRHVKDGVSLWVMVPRALKDLADRNGYTKEIHAAGGVLMTDSCPALGALMPKGTTVMATNSAKQAHYLPSIMGIDSWYGTTAECVDAAVSGKWSGHL